MAREERKEKRPVLPEHVMGGKYVRVLDKYLQQLREEEDHGNRKLFLDDVFIAYLLAFYNPSVRSLRAIEDFSQAPQVQRHLSIERICRSTLSDFNQLCDPGRLDPILHRLRNDLARKQSRQIGRSNDLQALLNQTIAVDGTFLHAAADVAWAVANSNNHGSVRYRARLDAHINVATWVPEAIVIPEPKQSEADSALAHIQAGCIYLYDRAYMSFPLLRAHYDQTGEEPIVRSHFVIRFKPAGGNSPDLHCAIDRPLTDEDRSVGIISDRIGKFTSARARRNELHSLTLREVILNYTDNGEQKCVRLITSLMDVSATTIATLYRFRWQVELFFRWFKSLANFGHLLSHCREGVLVHLYVTIIAVLLMHLHTGYRPSKYMFILVGLVTSGAATLSDIMPILRERERQCEVARQSAARRRAKKRS